MVVVGAAVCGRGGTHNLGILAEPRGARSACGVGVRSATLAQTHFKVQFIDSLAHASCVRSKGVRVLPSALLSRPF